MFTMFSTFGKSPGLSIPIMKLCMILSMIIVINHSQLVKADCQLENIHNCWNKFHHSSRELNILCNNVQELKRCIFMNGCCEEYEARHCLRVVDQLQIWSDHYVQFVGCPEPVCKCTCEEDECVELSMKNHWDGLSGKWKQHEIRGTIITTLIIATVFSIIIFLLW